MVVMFIVVIWGLKKRYAMWKLGKATPFNVKERLGERIAYFIRSGIFHRTILRTKEDSRKINIHLSRPSAIRLSCTQLHSAAWHFSQEISGRAHSFLPARFVISSDSSICGMWIPQDTGITPYS
jgi:hypothetical protein